jgi:hypothetical protein
MSIVIDCTWADVTEEENMVRMIESDSALQRRVSNMDFNSRRSEQNDGAGLPYATAPIRSSRRE